MSRGYLVLVVRFVLDPGLGVREFVLKELYVNGNDALLAFQVPELVGLMLLAVPQEHALAGLGVELGLGVVLAVADAAEDLKVGDVGLVARNQLVWRLAIGLGVEGPVV